MTVQTHPRAAPAVTPQPRPLRVIAARRRVAHVHLLTFVVGNAVFWTLWGALSVSAEQWYWWPVVPAVGWALVLAAHLWHAYRP